LINAAKSRAHAFSVAEFDVGGPMGEHGWVYENVYPTSIKANPKVSLVARTQRTTLMIGYDESHYDDPRLPTCVTQHQRRYSTRQLTVKWGSVMSHFYQLKAGVRVLLPILFGIYIDGLINLVNKTNIGCIKLGRFALVYFCMLMT